jgi:hypothetical protein
MNPFSLYNVVSYIDGIEQLQIKPNVIAATRKERSHDDESALSSKIPLANSSPAEFNNNHKLQRKEVEERGRPKS